MSAEQNEIALMSAEDKNVAVAPTIKKVKKPKIECCACSERFKGGETTTDAYGDVWCFDCYDDEYVKCFSCDEEIPREKYGEEYWERDKEYYCECCRDDYDAEEANDAEEKKAIPDKEDQRRKWVEDYNKSLPQVKQYDINAEAEISYAVGGIYDSEYMNYIYDGIETPRIKEIKKIQRGECFRG